MGRVIIKIRKIARLIQMSWHQVRRLRQELVFPAR